MQENPQTNHNSEMPEESNVAKRLRLQGDRMEDSIHDESKVIREYDRVENFWYHHKWTVIITAVILVCAIILGAQLMGRTEEDAGIMYVGPYYVGEAQADIEEALGFLAEDLNGDGEAYFRFSSLHCYTDAQLEELRNRPDANGDTMNGITFSQIMQANTQEKESYYKVIFLDEFIIWLLDPVFYEEVREVGGFMPLSEIFDYQVEAAIDETGIRFMETAYAQYYPCFADMPEDTVLCIRRLSTAVGKKGEAKHARNVEAFRAIVEFRPE